MEKKEYRLELECREIARAAGCIMLKLENNGHKGVPDDLLVFPDGTCKLIELKKGSKEKLRPEQKVWFERFPTLCIRIDNINAFKNLINNGKDNEKI